MRRNLELHAKQKNVAAAKAAPEGAGDTWLWTALDSDSKMILSYYVADRTARSARVFLEDLESRLAGRVQLSTDGLASYPTAVFRVFEGKGIDYAIVDKIYANTHPVNAATRYSPAQCIGAKRRNVLGNPDQSKVSTSHVERSNLTIRMTNRRYTRLTNGFSRKIQNHIYAVALGFTAYNFCKQHKAHRMSPAMAAGVTDKLWSYEDIVERMDYYAPAPKPRGPYKKRQAS